MEERLFQAYNLLRQLGVTSNYKGLSYRACTVSLCAEQLDRLLLITKTLYPEAIKRYQTNWKAVERNIRTVIGVAWERSPALLDRIADSPLEGKPCSVQFISMVTTGLQRGMAGL